MKIQEREIAQGRFLFSLSPREELASFLATRAHCLQDTKRFAEAAQAYRWAAELDPRDPYYAAFCRVAMVLSGVRVPAGFTSLAREAARELTRIEALDT